MERSDGAACSEALALWERIEVFDLDTRPPALLGLDTQSTSGRGLHIVVELADEWGWQTTEGSGGQAGKVVWAELAVGTAAGGRRPAEAWP